MTRVRSRGESEKKEKEPIMVKLRTDPVCEMEVDEERSIKSEYEGITYYFCSQECKEEFDSDPEAYV